MKKSIFFGFMCFVFLMAYGYGEKSRPVAVSPGSESGLVFVSQSCPTFSWSAVQWSEAYKVAVFPAVGAEVLSYEEMELLVSPIVSKEIQGLALSWTPSEQERLTSGEAYVWYVQAVDASGSGVWSEGRLFQVEEDIRIAGVKDKLRKSLKEYGMSDEDIERLVTNATAGLQEVTVQESSEMAPAYMGVDQGTEGNSNTYYGYLAGDLATGDYNSFFGRAAGYQTTGDYNTFVGYYVGRYNQSGSYNTMMGRGSGKWCFTGSYNTYLGAYAGHNTTSGNNTMLGAYAGYLNTSGAYNTFLGTQAGYSNTVGGSFFVGYRAGYSNTTGLYNTFIGNYAGYSNAKSSYNTFVGYAAGYYNNTDGIYNTFLGYYSGYNNTTGQSNTFIGYYAGLANTTGCHNTFLGYYTGGANTTGWSNTFLGDYAGYSNTTGGANTFVGLYAGLENTTGGANNFIGNYAGRANTTGFGNTFLGHAAGNDNTVGDYNTFIGISAGGNNTTAFYNTFIGNHAGWSNTTGSSNTFLGSKAGYSNSTGYNNVFLGYYAGYYETGSNKLYIDNSDTSTPLIYGEFDNDKVVINSYLGVGVTPTHRIDVTGGAYCDGTNWVDASSREYKENIQSLDTEEAIAALEKLEPVKFNYKKDKEEDSVGFIAEDVPELVATKDRKGMVAMDVVAVLTKVVQEQQKRDNELTQIVQKQQETIDELRKQIDDLKKRK